MLQFHDALVVGNHRISLPSMWFFRPVSPYALAAGLQLPYQFSIKKGEYPVNGIVLFAAGMLQDCMKLRIILSIGTRRMMNSGIRQSNPALGPNRRIRYTGGLHHSARNKR